jgi:hypothetical protein
MTRSVEELKRESERSRLALTATTHRLKEQLSQTAADLRRTVSPEHIKSEVSDYITDKTQGWLGALKRQAMENPMQAIAAGTAVAVPMLRLARAFPLPLLMMGAGLALTSKSARARAAEAIAPAVDKTGDLLNQAMNQTRSLAGNVKDGFSSGQERATEIFGDVLGRADDLTGDASSRVAETERTISDSVKDGIDAAKDGVAQLRAAASTRIDDVRTHAAAAPDKARALISDNAALIGGIGIAIGALIAAALPKSEAEAKALGPTSDSLRQAATGAAQAGLETVKDTARSAADAAQQRVADADLGTHATRMTQNIADVVKHAAEEAVSAAFNPSRTPNR